MTLARAARRQPPGWSGQHVCAQTTLFLWQTLGRDVCFLLLCPGPCVLAQLLLRDLLSHHQVLWDRPHPSAPASLNLCSLGTTNSLLGTGAQGYDAILTLEPKLKHMEAVALAG